MPQAPSITFLCVPSRISKGGTTAPPGSASILSLPPVSLSTRSAKNLRASCVVDDGGTADCILRVRGCWASAVPANANVAEAAETRAILLSELIFIVCVPPLAECGRAIRRPARQQPIAVRLLSARAPRSHRPAGGTGATAVRLGHRSQTAPGQHAENPAHHRSGHPAAGQPLLPRHPRGPPRLGRRRRRPGAGRQHSVRRCRPVRHRHRR